MLSASSPDWSLGAALSFKPLLFIVIILLKVMVLIILIVVVARIVVSIVVLSILVYHILLVVPTGVLAPPYHLNKKNKGLDIGPILYLIGFIYLFSLSMFNIIYP